MVAACSSRQGRSTNRGGSVGCLPNPLGRAAFKQQRNEACCLETTASIPCLAGVSSACQPAAPSLDPNPAG